MFYFMFLQMIKILEKLSKSIKDIHENDTVVTNPNYAFWFCFNLAMLRKKILVFVQKIELEFSEGVGMG